MSRRTKKKGPGPGRISRPQSLPASSPQNKSVSSKAASAGPAHKQSTMSSPFSIDEPRAVRDSPSYISEQRAKHRKAADNALRRRIISSTLIDPDLDSTYAKLNAQIDDTPKKESKDKGKKQRVETPLLDKLFKAKDGASSKKSRSELTPKLEGSEEKHATPKLPSSKDASQEPSSSSHQHGSVVSNHKKKSKKTKTAEDGTDDARKIKAEPGSENTLALATADPVNSKGADILDKDQQKSAESGDKMNKKKKKNDKKAQGADPDAKSGKGSGIVEVPATPPKAKDKQPDLARTNRKAGSASKSKKKDRKSSSKQHSEAAATPAIASPTKDTKKSKEKKRKDFDDTGPNGKEGVEQHSHAAESSKSASSKPADENDSAATESSSNPNSDAEKASHPEEPKTHAQADAGSSGSSSPTNSSSAEPATSDESENGSVFKAVKDMTKPRKKKSMSVFKSAERVVESDEEDNSPDNDENRGVEEPSEVPHHVTAFLGALRDLSASPDEPADARKEGSGDENEAGGESNSQSDSSEDESQDKDANKNDASEGSSPSDTPEDEAEDKHASEKDADESSSSSESSEDKAEGIKDASEENYDASTTAEASTEQPESTDKPRKRKRAESTAPASTVASRNPLPDPSQFPSAATSNAEDGHRSKKPKKTHQPSTQVRTVTINPYPRMLMEQVDALEKILEDYKYKADTEADPSIRLIALLDNANQTILRLSVRKVVEGGGPSATMQMQLTRIAKERDDEVAALRSQVWELLEEKEAREKKKGRKGR